LSVFRVNIEILEKLTNLIDCLTLTSTLTLAPHLSPPNRTIITKSNVGPCGHKILLIALFLSFILLFPVKWSYYKIHDHKFQLKQKPEQSTIQILIFKLKCKQPICWGNILQNNSEINALTLNLIFTISIKIGTLHRGKIVANLISLLVILYK